VRWLLYPSHSQAECPDWYAPMQACRYLGRDFCAAHGIPWCLAVEQWALVAQAAEAEAAEHRLAERLGSAGA
jgi:hypothetical protein